MPHIFADFELAGIDKDIFTGIGDNVFFIQTVANRLISGALSRHTDLQYCYIDRTSTLVCTPSSSVPLSLQGGIRIVRTENTPAGAYPFDCMVNICICGNYAIGNKKIIDSMLLEQIAEAGLEWIDVNQGYAGCSCIPIESRAGCALVTADPGIARACADKLDVLKISTPKQIGLAGYKHGFIGGISGVYKDTIYLNGRLDLLSDGVIIRDFVSGYGYKIQELHNGVPYDIGGLIFV